MPLEKPKNTPTTGNPSMISRTDRAFNIAPRVAGTPLGPLSPLLASNQTPKSSPKGNDATPVKTFLSSNITPRSGPRKARVDTASPTSEGVTDGTPRSSRAAPNVRAIEKKFEVPRGSVGLGLRCAGSDTTNRAGGIFSNGTKNPLLYRRSSPQRVTNGANLGTVESSPMFFHADEIKRDISSKAASQRTEIVAKPRSVLSVEGQDANEVDEIIYAASPTDDSQPKFFYANGMPETQSTTGISRSTASSFTSTRASPKQTSFSRRPVGSSQRGASPLKYDGVADASREASVSKRRVSSAGNTVQNQSHGHSARTPGSSETGRRSSLRSATIPVVRHNKASSVGSLDSKLVDELHITSTPKTPTALHPLTTTPGHPTPPQERQDGLKEDHFDIPSNISPSPQSPQSPQFIQQSPSRSLPAEGKLEQMNALAANARRERKVLDLEISNSSLLAINRTLEREMRKQTAELRRYRRLTSTGRISNAPSHRSATSRLSDLLDLDGSETERRDHDLDISSEEDNSTLSNGSSMSPASHDPYAQRQRSKDEKRLQLDFSRHQELLLDSQRINQSIKRCLGWTEDLIKEGQRALAYQARENDDEIRSRVLTPDEVEGKISRGRALLSPALENGDDPWALFGSGITPDPAIDVE